MSDREQERTPETGDASETQPGEGEVKDQAGTTPEAEPQAEADTQAVAQEESPPPERTQLETTQAGPSANERTWAALAHASILLTFALGVSTGGVAVVLMPLVPLAIWLAFRDKSRFVAFHAMQATVFQLASLAAWIVILIGGLAVLIPAWLITAVLLVVLIGLLLLPVVLVLTIALPVVLIVLPLASLVYGLYGALEVYSGRPFRYWKVADWIESRGVHLTAETKPA
jgi:uncharacterized Tic20 family protein